MDHSSLIRASKEEKERVVLLSEGVLSLTASATGLLLRVIIVPALCAIPPATVQQDGRGIRVCCQHCALSRLQRVELKLSLRRRCVNFRIDSRLVASTQDAAISLLKHQKPPASNMNEGNYEAERTRHWESCVCLDGFQMVEVRCAPKRGA